MQRLEFNAQKISTKIKDELETLPQVSGVGSPYITPEMQKVLNQAKTEAGKLRDEFISTEHLLLGLIVTFVLILSWLFKHYHDINNLFIIRIVIGFPQGKEK